MPRGHKYLKKYRNSHGNWTYVYDLPKGADDTRNGQQNRSAEGPYIDTWSYNGLHDNTYSSSSNPYGAVLTARDRFSPYYYNDRPWSVESSGVHRRGEGLGRHRSQRQMQQLFTQAIAAEKKRKEEANSNPLARRKRLDVYRRQTADMIRRVDADLKARKEREKNLSYKARRKFAKAKQTVHYLDPDQEAWAKVFRDYESKATHEQSKRAKSGPRRRVTK